MGMKPIVFSSLEVRAILDGTKSMARRVMKPTISSNLELDVDGTIIGYYDQFEGHVFPITDYAPHQPGDVLWVKETWCEYVSEHVVDGKRFAYKANIGSEGEARRQEYIELGYPYKWRSPRFMPRVAARIFLRVLGVNVQRIQDISQEDVIAEGFRSEFDIVTGIFESDCYLFKKYWDNLNAKKKGCSWEENPFYDMFALLDALADHDKPCECKREIIDTSCLTRSRLFWWDGYWCIETIAGRFDANVRVVGVRYCCFCGHILPDMEG